MKPVRRRQYKKFFSIMWPYFMLGSLVGLTYYFNYTSKRHCSQSELNQICGKVPESHDVFKVINGKSLFAFGHLPWSVLLKASTRSKTVSNEQENNHDSIPWHNNVVYCSGSLISPVHILSSSWCFVDRLLVQTKPGSKKYKEIIAGIGPGPFQVQLRLDAEGGSAKWHRLSDMYIPKSANDLLVARLHEPVNITPVCLPSINEISDKAILSGWACTDGKGQLTQYNVSPCAKSVNNQICFKLPSYTSAVDNGGGYVSVDQEHRFILMAVHQGKCSSDDDKNALEQDCATAIMKENVIEELRQFCS